MSEETTPDTGGMKDTFKDVMSEDQKDAYLEAVEQLTNYKNIDLKTDIPDSIRLSIIHNIGSWMEDKDADGVGGLIQQLVTDFKVYQVSKDRKSRKEVVDVLRDMEKEEEESELNKLLKKR